MEIIKTLMNLATSVASLTASLIALKVIKEERKGKK